MNKLANIKAKLDALRADAVKLTERIGVRADASYPYLRTALKHYYGITAGHQGETHVDLEERSGHEADEHGFLNHKGHWMNRSAAADYAHQNGLIKHKPKELLAEDLEPETFSRLKHIKKQPDA